MTNQCSLPPSIPQLRWDHWASRQTANFSSNMAPHCVCLLLCCALGWVKCRAQILSMGHHTCSNLTFTLNATIHCYFDFYYTSMIKRTFLLLITHPHVVPNTYDLRSSSEHKLRYFDEIWEVSEKFRPSIDSNLSTYLSLQWSYAKIQTLTLTGNLMQLIQYYINYWAQHNFFAFTIRKQKLSLGQYTFKRYTFIHCFTLNSA